MTPTEYLDHVAKLSRPRDMVGIMAFTDEHLTEEMLDEMTPQQRRDVHGTIHIAAHFVGKGPLDPPTGIPIDDLEDEDLAAAATNDSAAPSELPDRLGTRRLA